MASVFRLLAVAAGVVAVWISWSATARAQATWMRAESDHFTAYSNGDERVLRDTVRNLEVYHWLLARVTNTSAEVGEARRLPIYLVQSTHSLQVFLPGAPPGLVGFYSPSDEGAFAVAIRQRSSQGVLLHEYAHHFMYQFFIRSAPAWYVEGYAEYFMTADIQADHIIVGRSDADRMLVLSQLNWLPMDRLLRDSPGDLDSDLRIAAFYSQAWALTHWMHQDPERNRMLGAYLADVGSGGDPVEAFTDATGLSLRDIEAALRRHYRTTDLVASISLDGVAEPQIEITHLSPAEGRLLLLSAALGQSINEEFPADLLGEIREIARRFPTDRYARLTLARAEIKLGDPQAGTTGLEALLEDDPRDLEALIYLSMARREAAGSVQGAEQTRLLNESNQLLVRALEIDPEDFRIYYGLARNRVGARNYPSENDVSLWINAFGRAPQIAGIRLGLAEALMSADRFDDAESVLAPLAHAPHQGDAATRAAELLELARAGLPPTPEQDEEAAPSDEEAQDSEPTG